MPWNIFALVAFLLVAGVPTSLSSPQPRPNIVLIFADDLGINDLSCYGRKDHKTPNLDLLATQGLRFSSALCAQPICSPSRAALMTGKTPARLHLTTYLPGRKDSPSQKLLHPPIRQALPLAEKTIAEHLREAGYATACIGKWHLGGQGFLPTDQGFDQYYPGRANTPPTLEEGSKGELDLTLKAEGFIEAHRDQPFFLFLPHNSPHIPYAGHPARMKDNQSAFDPAYADVIETLDRTVGRLLRKLDALALATNTLVIFTSDNGGLHVPEGGHARITFNAPFRAGKGFLYEGGLRIPLIVRWPGHINPGVTHEPLINTDWLPTFLGLLGQPQNPDLDGVNMAGFLLQSSPSPARRFFWHFPHYTNQGSRPGGAVRDGHWKYIYHYDSQVDELYNLSKDPSEKSNLAATFPQRVAELRSAHLSWLKQIGAQENSPNPAFHPASYAPLYIDLDISKYEPEKADATALEQVLAWRKKMNEALR